MGRALRDWTQSLRHSAERAVEKPRPQGKTTGGSWGGEGRAHAAITGRSPKQDLVCS